MSKRPRGANGGTGSRRSGLGTKAIQVAAIALFFIQLGKLRHRLDKRLTEGLSVSYVPLGKDSSSHSMLVWPYLWF